MTEVVSLDDAIRRNIGLLNPRDAKGVQANLGLGLQCVLPGEQAISHRHSAAAIRFVVQGKGAYTTVEGEKFFMEEGDLILTPNWTWHDHHNESEDPIIWLDGLDGPLIQSLDSLIATPKTEKPLQLERSFMVSWKGEPQATAPPAQCR